MKGVMLILSNRSVLYIDGENHRAFLHALCTQNVVNITQAAYAVFLNSSGRYLFDCFLIPNNSDGIWIDISALYVTDFLTHLNKYKLRQKVNFRVCDDMCIGFNTHTDISSIMGHNAYISSYVDPRVSSLGWRSILHKDISQNIAIGDEEYNMHRLICGVPDGNDFISEKSFPMESGMDDLHAICWNKGCYVGQENTARTRYRGEVRKLLLPVILTNSQIIPYGSNLCDSHGMVLGNMRSSMRGHGIALVRLQAFDGDKHKIRLYAEEENCVVNVFWPRWLKNN